MEKKTTRFPRIYFGWWTALAGGILALWGYGYQAYGISALFKPIASELGFSRTATSVAASIGRFEGGFEAPLVGWMTDRFGPRWIVFCGIFFISVALVLMYFGMKGIRKVPADKLVGYYVTVLVISIVLAVLVGVIVSAIAIPSVTATASAMTSNALESLR